LLTVLRGIATRTALSLRCWALCAVLVVAAPSLILGCGGSSSSMRITVSPAVSGEDQPVQIAVSGLSPDATVTLKLTSTDADGVAWASAATYRPDAQGKLNVDRSAPLFGDYSGVDGMGLIWSMEPVSSSATSYAWSDTKALAFTLSVALKGSTVASSTFQRRLSGMSVFMRAESLQADGFVGEFFAPTTGVKRPAILTLGGSEGGNSTVLLAQPLAAQGYPTLALAYFGEPGLPQTLSDIPLEYFATALTWLDHQPGVEPDHVLVFGASRGSEAALLLGVYYPQLVDGVIASVPSDVALCSPPGARGRSGRSTALRFRTRAKATTQRRPTTPLR